MSTTLAMARPRVVQGVIKSGGDPSRFSALDADLFIKWAGNKFVNRTRCTRSVDAVDLIEGDPEVDFAALADNGFHPDMLIESGAMIVADANYSASEVAGGIEIIGIGDIRQKQARASTGTPKYFGFADMTTVEAYPTPKADGESAITWSPPFTDFIPGTQGNYNASINYYLGDVVASGGNLYTCIQPNGPASAQDPASAVTYWTSWGAGTLVAPASVVLHIPEHLIDDVLLFGAGAGLIASQEELARMTGLMAVFEQHIQASMGRGGLGAKTSIRSLED